MILCSQSTTLAAYTNFYHSICASCFTLNIGSNWMQSFFKQPPAPRLAPFICSIHRHSLATRQTCLGNIIIHDIWGFDVLKGILFSASVITFSPARRSCSGPESSPWPTLPPLCRTQKDPFLIIVIWRTLIPTDAKQWCKCLHPSCVDLCCWERSLLLGCELISTQ